MVTLAAQECGVGQVRPSAGLQTSGGCYAWARGCRGTALSAHGTLFPVYRLLFLKLTAQNPREKFAFCSVKGCERIKIKALIPKDAGVSDCSATAYPRFTERATVDVPMPRKLGAAQLVSGWRHTSPSASGAAQVISGRLLSTVHFPRRGWGPRGDNWVYGRLLSLLRPTNHAGHVCFPEDKGPLLGGEDGKF